MKALASWISHGEREREEVRNSEAKTKAKEETPQLPAVARSRSFFLVVGAIVLVLLVGDSTETVNK